MPEITGDGDGHRPIGDRAAHDAENLPPAWFSAAAVAQTLDARPMLARGEHPAALVMEGTAALGAAQIFELITPFEPLPLIEKVCALGYDCWVRFPGDGTVRSFFRRK